MKKIDITAAVLVLAGAINWGLVGLFDFDAIDYILGQTWLLRFVYAAIGFSALYKIINWQSIKARWKI